MRELRRQNRKLRRRLTDASACSTPARRPSRPASSVVHRMSALFDGRLGRFMSSSGGCKKPPPSAPAEVRMGARERLSTPPKEALFVSSYSTDLSSDSSATRGRKAPPLVLPEVWDSDTEPGFAPAGFSPLDSNCLSPGYPRRSLTRRSQQRSSISENTSPSSVSVCSSVEHSDPMSRFRTLSPPPALQPRAGAASWS